MLLVAIPLRNLASGHAMVEQRAPSRRVRRRKGEIGEREADELRDGGVHGVRNAVFAMRRGQLLFERRQRAHVDEQHELVEVVHGVVDRADRAAGFFGEVARPQFFQPALGDRVLGGGDQRLPQPVAPPGRRVRLN